MTSSNIVSEEILDFAQCYLYSGLTLSYQFKNNPPYQTILDHSKGYILCSHFLMAHGIELYLKFIIKTLKGNPSSNTHNLSNLNKTINSMLANYGYKRNLFNKKELELINYLDRYEKFRYPVDKKWNLVTDIFNESEKWNEKNVKKFNITFEKIIIKLNDWGYKINKKLN
jgi:hypothetical protein